MTGSDLPTEQLPALPPSARRLATSIQGRLVFVELPETGRLVVGRSGEADVVLDHESISRKHFTLHVSPTLVKVEDLGSANGTTLGGRKLAKGVPEILSPGVTLEAGTLLLSLQDGRASAVAVTAAPDDTVVEDPVMIGVHDTARIAANSALSVLLLGETGVGKEVFARKIHEQSPRRAASLVKVNCAALVESLLEAELFGYERGAFTGATHAKPGLLEAASGGTLFLDEVGELPLATQAKLLRVLESGEVTRVGALKPQIVDVRFVSATHRDLAGLVREGRFREDLLFRLDGVSIRIPPLRERTAEIVPLARSFVVSAARAANRAPPAVSDAALNLLVRHRWTGNVRELRNVIQRSVLFCSTGTLDGGDIRFDTLAPGSAATPVAATQPAAAPSSSVASASSEAGDLEGLSVEDRERRAKVMAALEASLWNQTRAADQLGIARRTLHSWMNELRIPRSRGSR